MLISNTCSFQKKMLSNLTCVLTHWQNVFLKMVLKIVVFWKFCKTCRNISMTKFTVKEDTVFRAVTFLNEALHQM